MTSKMTGRQQTRQRTRQANGQYEAYSPCDLCGKPCDRDDAASVPWIDRTVEDHGLTWDWNDEGILLHPDCATKLTNLGPYEAWRALGMGDPDQAGSPAPAPTPVTLPVDNTNALSLTFLLADLYATAEALERRARAVRDAAREVEDHVGQTPAVVGRRDIARALRTATDAGSAVQGLADVQNRAVELMVALGEGRL